MAKKKEFGTGAKRIEKQGKTTSESAKVQGTEEPMFLNPTPTPTPTQGPTPAPTQPPSPTPTPTPTFTLTPTPTPSPTPIAPTPTPTPTPGGQTPLPSPTPAPPTPTPTPTPTTTPLPTPQPTAPPLPSDDTGISEEVSPECGCEESENGSCPSSSSSGPVRYSRGLLQHSETDLSSSAFGLEWGHTRNYVNILTNNAAGLNGNSWLIKQLKYIVFVGVSQGDNEPAQICVMDSASSNLWFERQLDGTYQPQFRGHQRLVHDEGSETFVLTENNGFRTVFYDNSFTYSAILSGRLKSIEEPSGRVTIAVRDISDRLVSFTQSDQAGRITGYYYQYFSEGPTEGYISEVRLQVSGEPVLRSQYNYYTGSEPGGLHGDLRHVSIQQYVLGNENWETLTQKHYRYYLDDIGTGFAHGLRYIISGLPYQRMVEAGLNPLTAPESQLAAFANQYVEYDSSQRVTLERLEGGSKEYTFTYLLNSDEPGFSDVNEWNTRTVETLPDSNENRVYTNKAGQVILKIFEETATGNEWYEFHQYNAKFQAVLKASSAAVNSVAEPAAADDPLMVTLKTDSGLIREYVFYTFDDPDTGAVRDYLEKETVKEGSGGAAITLRVLEWDTQEAFGTVINPLRAQTLYPIAGSSDDAARTAYSYTYYNQDAEPTFQVEKRTVTPPIVPTTQHGTNTAEPSEQVYDTEGKLAWERNARGFITHYGYDLQTDARVLVIQDVDTSRMSGVPSGWSTPVGGGRHLVTDYITDDQGRTLKELMPWIEVDPATVDAYGDTPLVVRPVNYTLFRDAEHQEWRASGWMSGTGYADSWHITGPVSLALMDEGGNITDEIEAPPACACGPLGPDTFCTGSALPEQCTWTRWTHYERDTWGKVVEVRVYYSIPSNGEGLKGVNYNATRQSYDIMNRVERTVSSGGTITRLVYDARGLGTARWVGTDDVGATPEDPSGGGAPGNNMKSVWLGQYDDGQLRGDGNLTQQTEPADDNSANDRVVSFAYDFRNRKTGATASDGSTDFINTTEYDNLDRVVTLARYHTSVATANRTHESRTSYDRRNRVYESRKYYVNSDGTLGDYVVAGPWYDPNDNVIKQTSQGAKMVTKRVFDSLDRLEVEYKVSENSATSSDSTNSVALDVVIVQLEPLYNDAGHLIATIERSRFDDAAGTGPLLGPKGSEPRSRDTFMAYYSDPIARVRFTANYGTNGGAQWSYPGSHAIPSDVVLVSEVRYALDGLTHSRIDPLGTTTVEVHDQAGRRVRMVENSEGQPNQQRVSQFQYAADGGLHRLILINSTTGDQVTTWTYGTTLVSSDIARSDLPVRKTYPTGEYESQTYNRQNEVATFTDANGSVHTYGRDELARLTDDGVTSLASGVDGTVRRISTSYDLRGRVEYVTSADNATSGAGTVVNQVKFEYNGIDCLTADIQSHAGVGDGSTPKVEYQCTGTTNGLLRRTAVVYPDGRQVDYEYGIAGSIDDVLNRVQSVHDDDLTVLAEFRYVGTNMPVVTTLPQPEVERRWKKLPSQPDGDAGDPYTGYDRFGRIEQMQWAKDLGSGNYCDLVKVQWGYNRASLKTWRTDLLATSSAGQDQHFSYDGLYQVTERQRGLLNVSATAVGSIPTQQENFSYDEAGNWVRYEQSNNGDLAIDETRVNNRSNQVTQVDGSSAGVAYDKNGNMLLVPTGEGLTGTSRQLTWDAWNRLVKVREAEDTIIAVYQYDGRTRRITSEVGGVARHFYYNDAWRSVEERVGNATIPDFQYVWQSASRWDLILRDEFDGTGDLDRRLYSIEDNLEPVAICDSDGAVVERYSYSAFGLPLFYSAAYVGQSSSQYGWNFLYHAEFEDMETSYYNYGYRYYLPTLGAWACRDPLGYKGGTNPYSFVGNNVVNYTDYLGLLGFGDLHAMEAAEAAGYIVSCGQWMYEGTDVELDPVGRTEERGEWEMYDMTFGANAMVGDVAQQVVFYERRYKRKYFIQDRTYTVRYRRYCVTFCDDGKTIFTSGWETKSETQEDDHEALVEQGWEYRSRTITTGALTGPAGPVANEDIVGP